MERDLAGSYGEIFDFYFNSHAHVERDGEALHLWEHMETFQLTRSRGA